MTDSKPDLIRKSFIGGQGLRAGWSALVFLAIVVSLSMAGGVLVGHFFPHSDHEQMESPGIGILKEGVLALAIFIATWVMAKIEKRPVWSYGLTDSRMARRFFAGFVVGLLSISAMVGALWSSHLLAFDGELLSGGALWGYAALWGLQTLVVALAEEGLFRGYLLYTLTRGLNFWWAALIMSVLFGAAHAGNSGESPLGLITVLVGGLMLCLSIRLTGSLWWAIGMHTAMNWAEAYLYGVADSGVVPEGRLLASHPIGAPILSGGTTGPEGSVYAVMVLLAVAGGLWLVWGRDRKGIRAF